SGARNARSVWPKRCASSGAGSPMSARPTAVRPIPQQQSTALGVNWPFGLRAIRPKLFGNFDGSGALCGLLGAQYPDQAADQADDEIHRAIEQGNVDALAGH